MLLRDAGNALEYLKDSGVKSITMNTYSTNGTCTSKIGDDLETTDVVEFASLNTLKFVKVKSFDSSLIKTCYSLTNLTLDTCDLNTTSNLIDLTSLTYLNLDHNGISTLEGLVNMSSLEELHLDTNNLTLAALNTLKDLHENGSLTKLYITNNSTLDKTKIKSLLVDSEVEWEVLEYDKD